MRPIDADEIHYDKLLKSGHKEYPLEWAVSHSQIDNMPTIDAVPVIYGKWIDPASADCYRCSVCEEYTQMEMPGLLYHFCPNCGAKMTGEKVRQMTAIEKIELLQEQIKKVEEKYCKNCQEWDCEDCWAMIDGEREDDGT